MKGGPGVDYWGWIIVIIFFYYFSNAIISTLHIISLYYCLHWYLIHSYSLLCFDVFPLPLKSTLLATKIVSPPTVFDLGGWNRQHFVGNWIAETITYYFLIFNLFPVKTCNSKKKAKNLIFWRKKLICFRNFYLSEIQKNGIWHSAPSHGK